MKKTKPKYIKTKLWRILAAVTVAALAIWLLINHWSTVLAGIVAAKDANGLYIAGAVVAMASTWPIAAVIYKLLAQHRIRFIDITIIETATSFANRLLPAGVGGLGLHGRFLYKRKHTTAEATAVVSVNNLLGVAAHASLLVMVVLLYPDVVSNLKIKTTSFAWQGLLIVALLLIFIAAIPHVRKSLTRFLINLGASFRKFKLSALLPSYFIAMILTSSYVLALWCICKSIGVELSVTELFIVFTSGMLAGTATPTPGGLVGAEAGLFACLIAYNIPHTSAAAVVLLFRLVTYWLPIIPGFAALLLARKRILL